MPMALFLCGDVMTGRGIDQILPHPGDPVLHEPVVRDAREYVRLAEQANGPIAYPVPFGYPWGEALEVLQRRPVDLRIINLETSIARSGTPWSGKVIHYRMHPGNIGCLTAAAIHCCGLANNHVLDWGEPGLIETLQALQQAGIASVGAGRTAVEAASVATLEVAGKGRVLISAAGSPTSGIPWNWGAMETRPGIHLLEDLSAEAADRLASAARRLKRPGDIAVISIHWGDNWGYAVPDEQVDFAHRLIDHGIDIVHGHSSHHVKGIEVYRNRLILYGCGDFLNDYEGIQGYEDFRDDLRVMYLVQVDAERGELLQVQLVPMQARCFRLQRASAEDVRWLTDLLNHLGSPLHTSVHEDGENGLVLRW